MALIVLMYASCNIQLLAFLRLPATVTCTIFGVYSSAVLQTGIACQNEIGKYVLKQLTTAGLLCLFCDDTEMIAMCISLCATWFETMLNVCVSCSCLCISTSTLTEYLCAYACWLTYMHQDLEIFLVLQVCRCFLNGDCLGCCKHAKSKCSMWPVSACQNLQGTGDAYLTVIDYEGAGGHSLWHVYNQHQLNSRRLLIHV